MKWRLPAWPVWKWLPWLLAAEIAATLVAAAFFLHGGDDLYRYYLPFVKGCLTCGFVPYFARWLLAPLALLPGYPLAWPLWTAASLAGFLVLVRLTKASPLWLLLSFPMFGQVWLGQVDVLVAAGLVVFLLVRNPYLRGLGIVLALAKPQLVFLPLLCLLVRERPASLAKMLAAPAAVFLASLPVFGVGWPLEWLHNSMLDLPVHVWRLAGMDAWRFGLILIWAPLLFRDPSRRMLAGLLVSALATPFFGVYSYVLFFLFGLPWWSVPVSYAWALAVPLFGAQALRFAWILPLSLLAGLALSELKARRIPRAA